MSEDKTDRMNPFPSGCPSPARVEKTDSSSSRQSGSPIHWDFESWMVSESLSRSGRIRPSSWDDSDDDLSPKPDMSCSKASRIYSSESREVRGSISSEINALKRQFFESLEKEKAKSHDSLTIENLREKLEIRLKNDRRKSPARMRRRSRSSSSSSPAADTKCQNSPEAREKLSSSDAELDNSDQMSPNLDSRYYLSNFFSELRTKRISIHQQHPTPAMDKVEQDSILISDNMKLEMLNELNPLEVNEDGGYFCKTSRKLSQILEVEENRRDFERSSEESIQKSEPFMKKVEKPVERYFPAPLSTVRSKYSEKDLENLEEIKLKEKEGYKSLSFEEFGNFQKVGIFSRGSLSERSARIFDHKLDDDFILLSAKTGKTCLGSPKLMDDQNTKKPLQFFCLTSSLGENQGFSVEPSPKKENKENDSNGLECLEIDLDTTAACESPRPVKSSDRSEQTHSSRTKSGKSKRSSNLQSPKFTLSVGEDSARSVRGVNTPDSPSRGNSITHSERKIPSSEDCSPRKSSKSSYKSEGTSEYKTESNLHIPLGSPSLESVKSSSRSINEQRTASSNSRSGRSTRRSEMDRNKDTRIERALIEKNLENSRTKYSAASSRIPDKANDSSLKLESSKKISKSVDTLINCFSNQMLDKETPRSQNILKLDIKTPDSQRTSCRSKKAEELNDANEGVDQMQSNMLSHEHSERKVSSRRSLRSRKSTAHSIKRQMTPRNSGSSSVRYEDSLEYQQTPRVPILQEFDTVCDALSSYTPLTSASIKSSWREIDLPSQRSSSRSEALAREPELSSIREITFTPKMHESTDDRLFSSRKNSSRFTDSHDKMSVASPENISSEKSNINKSRPASRTSNESKSASVPPDVEKIDLDSLSVRSNKFDEGDEKEEIISSHGSKSGTESDRHCNKRLAVINEIPFQDSEADNFIENEEMNFWDNPRPPSKVGSSRRISPKSLESDKSVKTASKDSPKGSARSFEEKPSNESAFRKQSEGGGTWSELIETFEESRNSSFFSEKNFPGFPPRKEEKPVRLMVYSSMKETFEKPGEDDVESIEDAFKHSTKSMDGKIQTPKSEKNTQQRQEDYDFSLVCSESLTEKIKNENERSIRGHRNLYYVEVDKEGAFGIGEFGDMTCWSADKSDTRDLDKPQDHGDGMQAFRSSKLPVAKPEKKEKETKTQRQLWTELREDFRDSPQFSNGLFPEVETDVHLNDFIPITLKTSKSENCISRKMTEGIEYCSSATSEFLPEGNGGQNVGDNRLKNDRKSGTNIASNITAERSSSGSTDSIKEEEFYGERTPRLSRSLPDLDTQLKKEIPHETDSSKAQLFENPAFTEEKKESVNLSIFLARQKDKEMAVKSSNWLGFKNQEEKKLDKRDKKAKLRGKKSSRSPREPCVQYLTSRKSRSSIPNLKLRHSNCFQNFYKRFISVFCVTSNSSAATSK